MSAKMCEPIQRPLRELRSELYVFENLCAKRCSQDLTNAGLCQLATATNFLEEVAQCNKDSCEDGGDLTPLVTALEAICHVVGFPIPGPATSSPQAPTTVVTEGVTASDVGIVTIWKTSTSIPVPILITTTILTVVTNNDGVVQTAEVPEYYNGATTVYGNPVVIVVTTTAQRSLMPTPLASTETVVVPVDSSSTVDAISVITGTVLPLMPVSSTTISVSTDTVVVVATAATSSVNGSPFSSQTAAPRASKMNRLLMLGVGLVVGLLFI
jgi:hypothetical protein